MPSTVRTRLPGSQFTVRQLPRTEGGADRQRELPWHSCHMRHRPEWQEDEALLAAEAQHPGGDDEIHWSELESDSSEDAEYFLAAPASHDHDAGGSREPAPLSPAAATVT